MFRVRHLLLVLAFIPVLLNLSACANYFIAMQMVSAPNDSLLGTTVNEQFSIVNDATDRLIEHNGFQRRQVQLDVEGLTISYFDIAAGNYGYTFATKPVEGEGGDWIRYIHTHWTWPVKQCHQAKLIPEEKGVLLMLHGWARDNRSLVSYGVEFAQQGYRVIIPDLRGHGMSGGDWLSFGEQESADMMQFADHLGLTEFDVFGFSLGAATAIQLGSRDDRVKRIIAVAAMHSIAETIPKFGARSRPWIANLLDGNEVDIVESARGIAGYDYQSTSDTLSAAAQLHAPTLLVYGEIDQMSDRGLNQKLFDQLQGDKQLIGIPRLRHTHVLQHQTALMAVAGKWFGIPDSKGEPPVTSCARNEFLL